MIIIGYIIIIIFVVVVAVVFLVRSFVSNLLSSVFPNPCRLSFRFGCLTILPELHFGNDAGRYDGESISFENVGGSFVVSREGLKLLEIRPDGSFSVDGSFSARGLRTEGLFTAQQIRVVSETTQISAIASVNGPASLKVLDFSPPPPLLLEYFFVYPQSFLLTFCSFCDKIRYFCSFCLP